MQSDTPGLHTWDVVFDREECPSSAHYSAWAVYREPFEKPAAVLPIPESSSAATLPPFLQFLLDCCSDRAYPAFLRSRSMEYGGRESSKMYCGLQGVFGERP